MIAINQEQLAAVGKNEKMEVVYQYLSGFEFRQKIEGIVGAFKAMHEQLDKERRAMERHWAQRQKQLELVIKNTAGMYGDLQGIFEGQIGTIEELEFDSANPNQLPEKPHAGEETDS